MKHLLTIIFAVCLFSALVGCKGEKGHGNVKIPAHAESCFKTLKLARDAQKQGNFGEAIAKYKQVLATAAVPDDTALIDTMSKTAVTAFLQLMNSYQSIGQPDACVEYFDSILANPSDLLKKRCMRTLYATMGYALSRTEDVSRSVALTDKALQTPPADDNHYNRFVEYSYAGAVYYSSPDRRKDCRECLLKGMDEAELCNNPAGSQYLVNTLGMMYRREGNIDGAIDLFSKAVGLAKEKGDKLGEANNYISIVEMLQYWGLHEMANLYASKGVDVISDTTQFIDNPMVRGQVYIYKALVLKDLQKTDSAMHYLQLARACVEKLPYNSGTVDIDITAGGMLIDTDNKEKVALGKSMLKRAASLATDRNHAVALYALAKHELEKGDLAAGEAMLDSVYAISRNIPLTLCIPGAYELGLRHYLQKGDDRKAALYAKSYLEETDNTENRVTVPKLTEVMVSHFMENKEMRLELERTIISRRNIVLGVVAVTSLLMLVVLTVLFGYRSRLIKARQKLADERLMQLSKQLSQTYMQLEKEHEDHSQLKKQMVSIQHNKQLVDRSELLKHDFRHKSTPGDFYVHFNELFPHFLTNLRNVVPDMGGRMELFCMLLVLNQSTSEISALLNIEQRSVNMMKYRLRQKLPIGADDSVEDYIMSLIEFKG